MAENTLNQSLEVIGGETYRSAQVNTPQPKIACKENKNLPETEIDKGTMSGAETLPEKSNTSKSEIVALQQTKREEVDQAPKPQESRIRKKLKFKIFVNR